MALCCVRVRCRSVLEAQHGLGCSALCSALARSLGAAQAFVMDHQASVRCIMRQSLLLGDYASAAAALSSLMQFANPEGVFGSSSAKSVNLRDAQLFVEVAWGTLELLRYHSTNAEQLRRHLKQLVQLYAGDTASKEGFTVELVQQLWTQGDLSGAVSVLHNRSQAQNMGGWHTSFALQALYGMAAYQQWLNSVQQLLPAATAQGSAGGAVAPLLQQLLAMAPGGTLGDTRKAALAEKHLKGALTMDKQQPLLVVLLCQAQLAQGKVKAAARAVKAAAAAMPAAADIHTLWALLQQQPALAAVGAPLPAAARLQQQQAGAQGAPVHHRGSAGGWDDGFFEEELGGLAAAEGFWEDGSDVEDANAMQQQQAADPVHAYRDACSAAVGADPLNWGALEGLMQVSGHCMACCAALVHALLLHLDVTGPAASQAAAGAAAVCSCTPSAAAGVDKAEGARRLSAAAAAVNGAPWPLVAAVLLQLGCKAAQAVEQQQQQQQQQQQPVQVGVDAAAGEGQAAGSPGSGGQQGGDIPAAAAAAAQGPSSDEVLQHWSQLCHCWSSRQQWWPVAVADLAELQLLAVAAAAASTRAMSGLEPAAAASQQQQQQQERASILEQVKQAELVVQQLTCKGLVLCFVLGVGNAYTMQLEEQLRQLEAVQQSDLDRAAAHGRAGWRHAACKKVLDALINARAALEDGARQLELLDGWKQQQQQQQPLGQHLGAGCGAPGLLGDYNDLYGAYRDLPGSWWAAFPTNLRTAQAHGDEEAGLDGAQAALT